MADSEEICVDVTASLALPLGGIDGECVCGAVAEPALLNDADAELDGLVVPVRDALGLAVGTAVATLVADATMAVGVAAGEAAVSADELALFNEVCDATGDRDDDGERVAGALFVAGAVPVALRDGDCEPPADRLALAVARALGEP